MAAREGRLIYVGNLPLDVKEREIEDLFYKYGRIRHVDLKTPPRPPGFCFIEFEDPRDAQDAMRGRDGYDFFGSRLRVEISHGGSGGGGGGGGGGGSFGGRDRERGGGGGYGDRGGGGGGGYGDRGGGGGGGYGGDRGGGGGGYGGGGRPGADPPGTIGARGLGPNPFGPSRRTDFRVIVTNLPQSCSWQDLKDHMRRAGEVTFAQVMREGTKGMLGLVDYARLADLESAINKLDDTEFKNPFDKAFIRVKEDKDHQAARDRDRDRGTGGGGGRSRSRSRSASPRKRRASRSASESRSRSRTRSRSRSRSGSPAKSPEAKKDSPARSE